MKTKQIIISITFLLCIVLPGYSQTAREIMDKASNAIDVKSMEMDATLKIYDARGNERVRQTTTFMKEFEGTSKTLIKFTAPPDIMGTALLIYDYRTEDDDIWIYMPALRKTRRIVSNEKGKSFMGSEFSNADMSRPNANDFEYKILSSENLNGKDCWKIESLSTDENISAEYGFQKKISWIEKGTNLCLKAELFDKESKLLKIQTFENYKKQQSGKYFAYSMKMENVQNQRKSVMEITNLQDNLSLEENMFTPAMMEK